NHRTAMIRLTPMTQSEVSSRPKNNHECVLETAFLFSESEGTMRTRTNTSRRRFLKHSAALPGAAGGAQLFGVPTSLNARGPNGKLGVAVIGCGNMGTYSTHQALKENFIAIADVDDNTVARTMKETVRGPRTTPSSASPKPPATRKSSARTMSC